MYATPIKQGSNIVGVLIGRRDGNNLSNLISDMGFGKRGYAFILAKDGTVNAHPVRDYVMEQMNTYKDMENDGPLKCLGLVLQDLKSESGVIT